MRVTLLEILMFFMLGAFVSCFIIPRLAQAAPEVRAMKATVLMLQLEVLTEEWKSHGGFFIPSPNDPALLTQHLLKCFTSPTGTLFSNDNDAPGAVREHLSRMANPSKCRLRGFGGVLVMRAPAPARGVIIAGEYTVLFDGRHWHVKSL